MNILYLGGNQLQGIPSEISQLTNLSSLSLSDNQIQTLPKELNKLAKLQSLRLHGNQLQTLPQDLVKLTNLKELSVRNNPLVLRFIKEWPDTVPSLLDISARCVKKNSIPFSKKTIPECLVRYLDEACHCDNPKCNGVYFNEKYRSVKFVDFCGKYRVPLMQYLCSSMCVTEESGYSSSSGEEEAGPVDEAAKHRMKKVLLG